MPAWQPSSPPFCLFRGVGEPGEHEPIRRARKTFREVEKPSALDCFSPYTKEHYVSHTVADYTAILKLIETRFGLPALTQRDAAQMDMTEFFDFKNPAWLTPPTPPEQNTSNACYLDKLP